MGLLLKTYVGYELYPSRKIRCAAKRGRAQSSVMRQLNGWGGGNIRSLHLGRLYRRVCKWSFPLYSLVSVAMNSCTLKKESDHSVIFFPLRPQEEEGRASYGMVSVPSSEMERRCTGLSLRWVQVSVVISFPVSVPP